jgi:hypothetical protein
MLKEVERFEKALFRGAYNDCAATLELFEREWGYSLWLLKSQLALSVMRDGPEIARAHAESFLQGTSNTMVRYLARHLGIRLDPSTTPARFMTMVARSVTDAKKTDNRNPIIPYRRKEAEICGRICPTDGLHGGCRENI